MLAWSRDGRDAACFRTWCQAGSCALASWSSAEACQQWMAERVKMAAEDGQRFATDSQKLMEVTARMFSNGWSGRK